MLNISPSSLISGACYEPPLTNVFTMQWFLTLFATCLPKEIVLRVWDAIFLEGSEVLLRTALCIWGKLARCVTESFMSSCQPFKLKKMFCHIIPWQLAKSVWSDYNDFNYQSGFSSFRFFNTQALPPSGFLCLDLSSVRHSSFRPFFV